MITRNQKGFTLSIMIVIAIIGILAAIAIPNFISYRNKAFCSRAESDASAIQAAIASYFSEPNNTAVSTATLQASSDRPALNPATISRFRLPRRRILPTRSQLKTEPALPAV